MKPILIKKKVLPSTVRGRKRIVIFKAPINKFVTRYDRSLFIYDSETFEVLKEIEDKDTSIFSYTLVKRNEETFLTSTSRCFCCYSIAPPYKLLKEYRIPNQYNIFDMLVVDDDHIITYHGSFLHLISHEQGKVIKKFGENKNTTWLKWIIKSKSFQNCFFVHRDNEDVCVRMYNYKLQTSERDFDVFKNSGIFKTGERDIMTMDSYLNKRKQEILICGGKATHVILYNLQEDQLIGEIRTREDNENVTQNWIFSVMSITDKYFLIGDARSELRLIEIGRNSEFKNEIGNCQLVCNFSMSEKKDWVMNTVVLRNSHNMGTIIVINNSGETVILEVQNIFFDGGIKEQQWKEDSKERIDFLDTHQDDYIFNIEESEKFIFVKLKLKNVEFEKILRILF